MDSDKNDDIPQRPAWTLFFEGPLYQKYLQYMKNHDLSKVLNNGSTITNKNNPVLDPPVLNNETNWLPYDASKLENEAGYPDYNYPPSYATYPAEANNGANGSPPPYIYPARPTSTSSEKFLTEPERKRRKRQTRGFICIGIMLLGAVAAATALIIHFVFITKKEQVYDGGTIHIPSPNSTSLFNRTLTQLTKDHIIFEENGEMKTKEFPIEDIMNGQMEDLLPSDIMFGSNKTTTTEKQDPELVLLPGDVEVVTNGIPTTVVLEESVPTTVSTSTAEATTILEATTVSGSTTVSESTTVSGSTTVSETTTVSTSPTTSGPNATPEVNTNTSTASGKTTEMSSTDSPTSTTATS